MSSSGVRVVETESALTAALAVRHAVFVDGQGVPAELEEDGKDDEAWHFLAVDEGQAIGAARLRALDEDTGKVERVAVRESHRHEGWGRRLVATVERTARNRGLSSVVLHAQTAVEGFYRELGYRTRSDPFTEAGIEHVEMTKRLD